MYSYETTFEVGDNSTEVCFCYTYSPGCRARINYDENDHPEEGPELELSSIEVEDKDVRGRTYWRKPTSLESTLLELEFEAHYDNLVEHAESIRNVRES